MLKKALAAAACAAFALAPSAASALVECQDGDWQCYRTCYLPHYENKNIYWVNC